VSNGLLNFGGANIGRRDAKTNEITSWDTLRPASRPRRGSRRHVFDLAGDGD
jgi:hypothetical protein